MKLLMAFLLGTFVVAVARADRPARRTRMLPMLLLCLVVSAGFLTRRFL